MSVDLDAVHQLPVRRAVVVRVDLVDDRRVVGADHEHDGFRIRGRPSARWRGRANRGRRCSRARSTPCSRSPSRPRRSRRAGRRAPDRTSRRESRRRPRGAAGGRGPARVRRPLVGGRDLGQLLCAGPSGDVGCAPALALAGASSLLSAYAPTAIAAATSTTRTPATAARCCGGGERRGARRRVVVGMGVGPAGSVSVIAESAGIVVVVTAGLPTAARSGGSRSVGRGRRRSGPAACGTARRTGRRERAARRACPISTIRPPSTTRMRSASTIVDSRCAMTIAVRPRNASSNARWIATSDSESRCEVASSRMTIFGFLSNKRAIASRCFSPPDIR